MYQGHAMNYYVIIINNVEFLLVVLIKLFKQNKIKDDIDITYE